jgi:hypothetical protein
MTAYPDIDHDVYSDDTLKWYYRWYIIVPALLMTGPLGLILVWMRPRTSKYLKILVSLVIAILTAMITFDTVNYYRNMAGYYTELGDEHHNLHEKKGANDVRTRTS